ncbi:hypothetical protein F5887DRAFT_923589 [Amanita rubescens]|nr:hypothetical protein F5887DRAFT_923589 [Amanita rubescens]
MTSLVHVCLPPTPLHLVWSLLLQTCLSTRLHLPRLPPNLLLPTEKIVTAVLLPLLLLIPLHDWRPYFPLTPHGLDPLSRFRHTAGTSYASRAFHSAYEPPVLSLPAVYSHKEIGKEKSVEIDVALSP